ncbi:hypothetical protein [Saccharopolyspora sp. ASAGF58]|uniref:hypothetical protein n=1 Tax=Saccharopolyspora sp. ASAGF58 TaxID=2719023 RepID=UPI0014467AB8|nr:hypothetical protein [Saccharopolyspora sp. ASAGF58]
MAACDEVAVPAQHCVWAHHQPQPAQQIPSQPVQQHRHKRPIAWHEKHPFLAELPLQDRDLMAQGQDLDVLVPITHRQQAQHGERAHSERPVATAQPIIMPERLRSTDPYAVPGGAHQGG